MVENGQDLHAATGKDVVKMYKFYQQFNSVLGHPQCLLF